MTTDANEFPQNQPVDEITSTPPEAAETRATVGEYTVPQSQLPPRPGSPWVARIATVVVAAIVGGLAGHFSSPASHSVLTISESSSNPGAVQLSGGLNIPNLVRHVEKSIVSIDVKANGQEDQGTGMIITGDGLVVTNNHVIAGAAQSGTITVTQTGTTKALPATLIGTNPQSDVALIRIDNASKMPAVTFGDSNKLQVGDEVVAIGNALGLAAGTPTVTSGIVSALGRVVTAAGSTTSETLSNMIQTDAAINPGNSGGPLLDAQGDVIGMDTAVAGTLPDGTSAQNIGFAIPVSTIKSLLPKLRAGQSVVSHGAYIGVEISTMTPALQAEYGYSTSTGALVMSVIAGTGAAEAGVKQGDIIVAIDGQNVSGDPDVTSIISGLRPGDIIHMKVIRNSQPITLTVTLTRAPNTQ